MRCLKIKLNLPSFIFQCPNSVQLHKSINLKYDTPATQGTQYWGRIHKASKEIFVLR